MNSSRRPPPSDFQYSSSTELLGEKGSFDNPVVQMEKGSDPDVVPSVDLSTEENREPILLDHDAREV